jgi:hypothetical protein
MAGFFSAAVSAADGPDQKFGVGGVTLCAGAVVLKSGLATISCVAVSRVTVSRVAGSVGITGISDGPKNSDGLDGNTGDIIDTNGAIVSGVVRCSAVTKDSTRSGTAGDLSEAKNSDVRGGGGNPS